MSRPRASRLERKTTRIFRCGTLRPWTPQLRRRDVEAESMLPRCVARAKRRTNNWFVNRGGQWCREGCSFTGEFHAVMYMYICIVSYALPPIVAGDLSRNESIPPSLPPASKSPRVNWFTNTDAFERVSQPGSRNTDTAFHARSQARIHTECESYKSSKSSGACFCHAQILLWRDAMYEHTGYVVRSTCRQRRSTTAVQSRVQLHSAMSSDAAVRGNPCGGLCVASKVPKSNGLAFRGRRTSSSHQA